MKSILQILNNLFLAVLITALISSCDKEEPIPSYIHIDNFTLTTNYPTEGSASHKITDAWIYVDGKNLGAYELPCTVPYIGEGEHEISIGAGIKQNGISETRTIYPHYKFYNTTVSLSRGAVTSISPSVTYFSGLTFDLNPSEDFESAGTVFCDTISTDTSIFAQTADVFEGSKSGLVVLDGSKTFYFGQSCNSYSLPKGGIKIYAEFNYKCNNSFVFGITSFNASDQQIQQSSLLTINPSENWNKLYVDLTGEVNATYNASASKFRFFLGMLRSGSSATAKLYLDNIKIVH